MKRLGDLIGEDFAPAERERLEHVHELLLEAGPPTELPPSLARPPGVEPLADVRVLPREIPRRRLVASLVLAAAIASATFGVGYLVADGGDSGAPVASDEFVSQRAVTLRGEAAPGATAVVRIGREQGGNVPMLVTIEGLDHLPRGDYYILYMTKDKRKVSCGTFNVPGGNDRAEVDFVVGYDLSRWDAFSLVRYRLKGHKEKPLLWGRLT